MKPINVTAPPNTTLGDRLYADIRHFAETAAPDTCVASGRTLAERYGITRSTTRRVLDRLLAEGLIYKIHGKGCFVSRGAAATERRTVLYVPPWLIKQHTYYLRTLRGLTEQAEQKHLRVQVLDSKSYPDYDDTNPIWEEELTRPDVAAILVPWITPTATQWLTRHAPNIQIVSFLRPVDYIPYPVLSVFPNMELTGNQSFYHLTYEKGCRRVLGVSTFDHFATGMKRGKTGLEGVADAELQVMETKFDADAASLAEAILNHEPDGLAFSDDRLAMETINELTQKCPGFLDQTKVISLANAGEDLLPRKVARLEFDGRDMGALAISALDQQSILTRSEIHVPPKFVPGR